MKRAKRTVVHYTIIKTTYSTYDCPHCKVKIQGAGISKNVTRFLCIKCGNEIKIGRAHV